MKSTWVSTSQNMVRRETTPELLRARRRSSDALANLFEQRFQPRAVAHGVSLIRTFQRANCRRQVFDLRLTALLQFRQWRDSAHPFSCTHYRQEQRLAGHALILESNHVARVITSRVGFAVDLLATRISDLGRAELGRLPHFATSFHLDQLIKNSERWRI